MSVELVTLTPPSSVIVCGGCAAGGAVRDAVAAVLDGGMLCSRCRDCGARIRPFDWHGADGLPDAYIGRCEAGRLPRKVWAWYSSGVVRAVPAVDDSRPRLGCWPGWFGPEVLSRGVLAHLLGLDVPPVMWSVFASEVVGPVLDGFPPCWSIDLDQIVVWLEATR